ncbi:hypothetical protein Dcar01_00444 [Deinococcus carri]|uniref:Uncharacterized protein n=2 Tax=Deinococcus carri TaxID=1211323 RepID=A0ABP9W436_9DEIO
MKTPHLRRFRLPTALLGLTALLTACPSNGGNGGDPPVPGAGGRLNPSRLSGQLPHWAFGNAEAALYVYSSEQLLELPEGKITAGGAVDIPLGLPDETFGLLEGCTFSGERSAPDAQIQFADILALKASGDLLGSLTETRVSDQVPLTRLYARQDATFKGTAICSDTTLGLDLSLKAGWNAVAMRPGGFSSAAPGTPVTLSFTPLAQEVVFGFKDTSPLVLRAGQPVTREVTVYQDGGVSGQIDLSTDVPGVVVTPGTLTLPSLGAQDLGKRGRGPLLRALGHLGTQAVTTNLTFSLDGNATTSNRSLNLLARQGSQTIGQATLSADIRVPSVQVGVNGPYGTATLSGYQGATLKVPLSLTPQDGLTGSVTLTLDGLPEGLSAAPLKVDLTANATTNLELPVQVAPGAALGEVHAQIGGSKVIPTSLTLQIKPARALLDVQGTPSSLTPAAQGVWVMAAYKTPTTSPFTPQVTFRRYVGSQVAAEVTLADVFGELLRVPGGDAYALSAGYSGPATTIYRLKDDGSVTRLPLSGSGGGMNMLYGKVDAQGRLWYTGVTSEEVGVIRSGLYRWDPATGKSSLIDTQNAYSSSASSLDFVASGNGRYLFYKGGYNSKPLLIDTETQAITPLSVTGGGLINSAAVSDSSQVWYETYGRLTRVNPDGTSTTFPAVDGSTVSILGLDRQQPDLLWLKGSGGIIRFGTADASSRVILTDMVQASALLPGGGLTFLTQESVGGAARSFLSTLR